MASDQLFRIVGGYISLSSRVVFYYLDNVINKPIHDVRDADNVSYVTIENDN